MKSLKDVKAQLLQDPEVSAEYEKQQPEFAIARYAQATNSHTVVRLVANT
jgi:hypothetical protein